MGDWAKELPGSTSLLSQAVQDHQFLPEEQGRARWPRNGTVGQSESRCKRQNQEEARTEQDSNTAGHKRDA